HRTISGRKRISSLYHQIKRHMKIKEMSIKESREKLFADPKFQAFLKVKIDAAEKFLATADLSAMHKNVKKE
ncbi:MAG TPA: hypothetical protein VN038_15055, partial [Dyadobacter sp.]|nr:hypothetical protein [Dyadobacter sp.]